MKANLGSQEYKDKQIIDGSHPAVITTMPLKINQTPRELPAGLVVSKDANGDILAYDPAGVGVLGIPVGILMYKVDTGTASPAVVADTNAVILEHGTVVESALIVNAVTPAAVTAADIAKLKAIGIYVR